MTGAALDERGRSRWLRAWAAIAASFGVNQAIKLAVRRPRPDLPGLPPLISTMSNRSYPSAHATTAATAMRILPPLFGRRGSVVAAPAIASAATAMSLSRLYLGVHWPSDVAAGFALGAAIGELAS